MMKSPGVSIVKWSSRSLVLSFVALLMAVTGLVHAGPMNVTPAGGGVVRAWSVPYNPTSVGMVTGLQGFLRTETGAGLLAQVPTLGIIVHMSPDSEVHRRIIGALGLSTDFEVQLQAAIQTSDNRALAGALGTILSAYHSQNAERKINEAIQSRSNEIAAAVSQGKISVTELSAAALDLAPFAFASAKAKAVEEMARAARSADTMDAAQRIASTIMQTKGSVASDQSLVMGGKEGIVSVAGQKDMRKDGVLQRFSARETTRWSDSDRVARSVPNQQLSAGTDAKQVILKNRTPLYLFQLGQGDHIYVDISSPKNGSWQHSSLVNPQPVNPQVFVGRPGQMKRVRIKDVKFYKDGGTTVITTSRGKLYIPAPSYLAVYKPSTWNGTAVEKLKMDEAVISALGVYSQSPRSWRWPISVDDAIVIITAGLVGGLVVARWSPALAIPGGLLLAMLAAVRMAMIPQVEHPTTLGDLASMAKGIGAVFAIILGAGIIERIAEHFVPGIGIWAFIVAMFAGVGLLPGGGRVQRTVRVEIGQKLPGLKLMEELPNGTAYWDQVIPSPFGDLVYNQPQFRDGSIRWRTKDGKTTIIVESGTGLVSAIERD